MVGPAQLSQSYRPGQTDAILNFRVFMWWTAEAAWHSIIIFLMIFNILGYRELGDNGQHFGIWDAGNASYTANLFVVTLPSRLTRNISPSDTT